MINKIKTKPKEVQPVNMSKKDKLLNLLEKGKKIFEAAGALGIKRSEAQRLIDGI